ncbi:hypothetical protein [[Kitasatospora] papulosa]|uniref:hypothetical protein n=1 Tax=[Kitasatospora] papulosa TaxID=1464011 RepID=UPI0036A1F8ED
MVRFATSFVGGSALVIRYGNAAAVAGDARLSTDSAHVSPSRLRRLVVRRFTVRRVEVLRPFVPGLMGELVDACLRGAPQIWCTAWLCRCPDAWCPGHCWCRRRSRRCWAAAGTDRLAAGGRGRRPHRAHGREEMLNYPDELIDVKRRYPGYPPQR